MGKIKVALLIDEYFGGMGTAFGGYGFLARKYITKYIPNEEIQIDVLLQRKQTIAMMECEVIDGINVYNIPGEEFLAKEWLEKQNYDLYLSIEMTYPSYEIMKLVDRKKLILWIQDPRPASIWEPIRQTMSMIKDPCVSDPQITDLVKNYLYLQKRVHFITQGKSLNHRAFKLYDVPENTKVQYFPNPVEIDFDYKFDISKKKKQVIFLGRLEAQKRAWLFCEVAKRMPEYEFYLMGKFFREEGENKDILGKYINANIPNLHFTGHLDGEEKEKLIKESRVILNTSIWEGIPISWLESLQYGTAIVSCLDNEKLPSRFGAYVGEILGDGFDEVDKFVPAIKELMENDNLYEEKALAAIKYIRKYHSVDKFKKDFRALIKKVAKEKTPPFNKKFVRKPERNYLDVKITYACNFKCKYCYQADENGVRQVGMLSKENAENLIKFIRRLNEKYYVTLAGGEPFVYPYLNYLAKELSKLKCVVNIITNFSAPFDKIEEFIRAAGKYTGPFSISMHIEERENMQEFYDKLQKLVDLRAELKLDFPILLTCVLTDTNFEKVKEADKYIKDNFGFHFEIQRVYDRQGKYKIYSPEVEEFMKARGLDVPVETINKIDFYKRLCWTGTKFFYIESNGDVRRCYTQQQDNSVYALGNLSDYKNIKILDGPYECLSSDYGNCICWKHFVRQKFYTGILVK